MKTLYSIFFYLLGSSITLAFVNLSFALSKRQFLRGPLLSFLYCVLSVSIYAQVAAPPNTSLTSASRKFLVKGGSPHDNIKVAKWADDILKRIEAFMEKPIPFSSKQPLVIVLSKGSPSTRPRIIKKQKFHKLGPQQQLILSHYAIANQEDMLEGLCSLLLNRNTIRLQKIQQRKQRLSRVPDWFSVGVAQHLFPETRQRNSLLVHEAWEKNRLGSLKTLFNAEYLPPGQRLIKSMAGVFIDFLSTFEEKKTIFNACNQAWATRESLTYVDWASLLRVQAGTFQLSKEWDLWLAHSSSKTLTLSTPEKKWTHTLKALDYFKLDDIGIYELENAPEFIRLDELPDYSKEKWFPPLISKLTWKIRFMGVGQEDDFYDVTQAYLDYFSILTKMNMKKKGWFSGAPSSRAALKQLNIARKKLNDYQHQASSRENYLNTFETPETENISPDINAARKKFLDQFDPQVP